MHHISPKSRKCLTLVMFAWLHKCCHNHTNNVTNLDSFPLPLSANWKITSLMSPSSHSVSHYQQQMSPLSHKSWQCLPLSATNLDSVSPSQQQMSPLSNKSWQCFPLSAISLAAFPTTAPKLLLSPCPGQKKNIINIIFFQGGNIN